MFIPLLALSIIFIISIFRVFLHHPGYRLPPGPKPWPIIGNLFDMKPLMFRYLAEMSEVYGPVTSLWIGSSLSINICNSDLAKQVLKENDQHLANRSRTPAISLLKNHGKELIWADYGNHYIRLRKFCNMELFSPKSVHSLRPIWEDEISIMVKSIFKDCNPERNSVLRDYLREAAFHIITRIVFGTRFANREGELSEQGKELKATRTLR